MSEENKCIFCSIIDGSAQSVKVYEDEFILGVLDIFPATPGHVLIIPKRHVATSSQLEDKEEAHFFKMGNKIASCVFEAMEAKGTNLLVSNGTHAGQKVGHVTMSVIPRYENDGVNISWDAKQIDEESLKNSFEKIVSRTANLMKETAPKKEEVQAMEELEEETFDNYRIP